MTMGKGTNQAGHSARARGASPTEPTREDRIRALLGGLESFRGPIKSLLHLHAVTVRGVSPDATKSLADNLRLSNEELASCLAVLPGPIVRRTRERVLSPGLSDRVLRLARVAAHAEAVLGGREDAASWLHHPNGSLGGLRPLDLACTDAGTALVEEVLGELDASVFG